MSTDNTTPAHRMRRCPPETTLILILAGLFIVLAVLTPRFMTLRNITNLVRQTAIIGIAAIGMTFVIMAGGIDLSVGSVLAVCGMSAALLMKSGLPPIPAVLIAFIVGILLGMINGILIYDGQVPPFIATLGMMTAARGVVMLISGARMVTGLPDSFVQFAQIRLLGIPSLALVWLGVILVSILVTTRMRFGRNIFAVGSNREAARLSGIDIRLTTYGVYIVSGLAAALAGVLMTSRLSNGIPTAGQMYELDAIAAAVVGGASLSGGEGTILGTVLGAVIIAAIQNGGNLLGINPFVLQTTIGILIVAAVLIDQMNKRKQA